MIWSLSTRLAAKVRSGATARSMQHKCGSARRPLCRRSGTGPVSGKGSDKLSGLGTPAPTDLKAKHDTPSGH